MQMAVGHFSEVVACSSRSAASHFQPARVHDGSTRPDRYDRQRNSVGRGRIVAFALRPDAAPFDQRQAGARPGVATPRRPPMDLQTFYRIRRAWELQLSSHRPSPIPCQSLAEMQQAFHIRRLPAELRWGTPAIRISVYDISCNSRRSRCPTSILTSSSAKISRTRAA